MWRRHQNGQARICSLHFRPENFELNVQRMRRATLKETAIPLDPVPGDETGQAISWTPSCKMQLHRGKTVAIFDYTSVHHSFLVDGHKKSRTSSSVLLSCSSWQTKCVICHHRRTFSHLSKLGQMGPGMTEGRKATSIVLYC